MSEITLTINGKQCKGKQGDSVLDVCMANGIELPTLCHYKGLSDVGACRMCLVEIEKERNFVPACTHPASDGQVVKTSNEKLEKYRRLILELLFTERNHLCAYCVASGDCELQNLAYKYQMDNARYQYAWPDKTVDSSHPFIVMDHNRCVLCGRCIRTCDEFTGAHALDFMKRGWKTNVSADINQPLGESSCISCGACFQACPTGAIFSKASAYKGRPEECKAVNSSCAICGIGCDITGMVKDNKLVRIDSPDMAKDRGLLCEMGRFEPLYSKAERITSPMKRNAKGQLANCSYAEAFEAIGSKLGSLESIAGLASGKANTEALKAFADLMGKTGSKSIDTLDGDDFRTITKGMTKFDAKASLDMEAKLEDILTADAILVIGTHLVKTHPVAASYIMRAVSKNKAQLVVLDPLRNAFTFRATVWLKPPEGKKDVAIKAVGNAVLDHGLSKSAGDKNKYSAEFKEVEAKKAAKEMGVDVHDIYKAAEVLAEAKNIVIIYGNGILQYKDADLVTTIWNLAALLSSKPKVISLKRYGNSRGAWELGLGNAKGAVTAEISKGKIKGLYLLLADDMAESQLLADNMKGVEFAVVQASYMSPVAAKANVVLPSLLWTESKGSYTTLDGVSKSVIPMVKATGDIKSDADTLKEVAAHLKK
ncbi:MAG: molybdopterin-dependent oxidoreductase [Dehalococcoidia bacterium]|nr:molybdopterin-dependent oxidoreductase [Dehalococcoidia bacterium]MDD5494988.1 molybdopterin-dependent oxidoreductase [Dehalococcoidia bacterium]